MLEVRGVQTRDIVNQPEDYAEIAILPNDAGEPTVYAAGKLLGPAKEVIEFILEGAASVGCHRSTDAEQADDVRKAVELILFRLDSLEMDMARLSEVIEDQQR